MLLKKENKFMNEMVQAKKCTPKVLFMQIIDIIILRH